MIDKIVNPRPPFMSSCVIRNGDMYFRSGVRAEYYTESLLRSPQTITSDINESIFKIFKNNIKKFCDK